MTQNEMYSLQNHNNAEELKRDKVEPGKLVCDLNITLSNDWMGVKGKDNKP